MPRAKSGRRKFQSMDFCVGFIKEAIRTEFKKKDKCNTRLVIELIHMMSLIDDNYDVSMFLKNRRPSESLPEPSFTAPTVEEKEGSSQAVEEMLNRIREEKKNGSPADTAPADENKSS